MSSRSLSASFVAGVGIALGVAIPAAQATAPVVHRPAAATQTSQALAALDARWNAEAASYRSQQSATRALKALDARWNAQARYFGRR